MSMLIFNFWLPKKIDIRFWIIIGVFGLAISFILMGPVKLFGLPNELTLYLIGGVL